MALTGIISKLSHDDFLHMVPLSPQISSCWNVVEVREGIAVARDRQFGAGTVAPSKDTVVSAVAAPNIGVGNYGI